MNLNNNANNMQNDPRMIMAQQLKTQLRTSGGLKFCIMILLGFMPMFIMWMGLRTGETDSMLGDSPKWAEISYGLVWLSAIVTFIVTIILSWFLVKYSKDFKIDVIGSIVSVSFIMFIFYISPTLPVWARFLIALPLSMIVMVFANIIAYVTYFASQTKNFRGSIQEMQNMFKKHTSVDVDSAMKNLDEQLKSQGIDIESFDKEHEHIIDPRKKHVKPGDIKTNVKIKDKKNKELGNKDKKKDEN